jgi:hypothetical protein
MKLELLVMCLVALLVAGCFGGLMYVTMPECRIGKPVFISSGWLCDANRM